jgi:alkylhydroperoxidase family enzyme
MDVANGNARRGQKLLARAPISADACRARGYPGFRSAACADRHAPEPQGRAAVICNVDSCGGRHRAGARLALPRPLRYIAGAKSKETVVARVTMIKPQDADAETRKVYDAVVRQWGRISNFSQVLAHQPAALAGWLLPNESIRLDNVKSDPGYVQIQQLVIIKTSALNRSAYCMSHNVPLGRKIGLTEAQIAAAQGSDYMRSPDLDERQKAAIRWAEAVTLMQARDDEDAFAAMRKHFSEKQIVELTVFCGMWNYSNRLCEALHVDLERPDKRIEFQQA